MMNKKRTREIGRTKYLMFLPLAALLMIISNIEAVAHTTKEVARDVIEAVEENLATRNATPDSNVATEAIQPEAPAPAPAPTAVPAPQQEKDKLVLYEGIVVDKDGNPIEGVQFLIDRSHKLPKGQSLETDKDGKFSFRAFDKARMATMWKKGDKEMLKMIITTGGDMTGIKQVMDVEWQDAPKPQDPENPIFEVVEDMPEFPGGGMPAMLKYLAENIKYPENAKKNGTQGRVVVHFIVNKDGSISDIGILRGIDSELDREAIRVISTMPKWKPGMQRGEAVRVKYTVPIMFRLSEEKPKYEPIDKIDEMTVVGYAGKEASDNNETVFEVVEKMPSFPGGMSALMEYLSKNIKYPIEAQKEKIQGRLVMQIIVDKNGNVTNPKIKQSVHPLLDAEAIRLTMNMPKWEPGTQRGEPVSVKYTFPILFRLE